MQLRKHRRPLVKPKGLIRRWVSGTPLLMVAPEGNVYGVYALRGTAAADWGPWCLELRSTLLIHYKTNEPLRTPLSGPHMRSF